VDKYFAGVIGFPVGHSISPAFQQAAFDRLGIPVRYARWETPPDELAQRIGELRDRRCLGANITIPHKERVLALLDEIEPLAQQVGALNTICWNEGRLVGVNTDVIGFRRALHEEAGWPVTGRHVVVLGAGGAARAVVLALAQDGATCISIANRHPERAAMLVAEIGTRITTELRAIPWLQATGAEELSRTQLLVNCTALGMAGSAQAGECPVTSGVMHRDLLIFDIVANPLRTPLIRAAEQAGAVHLSGLAMLVYQGAAAFERWTGRAAPIATMMGAATAAMRSLGVESGE
jgi:shikimate dehydrogenase